jgi:putative phosphoesterase
MPRIALLSDTHGHLDSGILEAVDSCDQIWHAGDVGNIEVIDQLEALKTCKGVYGNIDDHKIRTVWPKDQFFECDGLKVFMTHIGGYPPKYTTEVKKSLITHKPGLYICGHSHILKVMPDKALGLIHMNPGACGHHGFHKIRTILRFSITQGRIHDVEVVELGLRGR